VTPVRHTRGQSGTSCSAGRLEEAYIRQEEGYLAWWEGTREA